MQTKTPRFQRNLGVVCGDAGNRTPVRRPAPKSSPGAVCCFISQPLTSCRPAASRLSRLSVEACSSTRHATSGSQNDARHQAGSTTWADGLRVHAAISGGENVVGAILFGTYWFERIVNELSEHPRPASLRSTTVVETDHPLLSFHSSEPFHPDETVRIHRVPCRPFAHKRSASHEVPASHSSTLTNPSRLPPLSLSPPHLKHSASGRMNATTRDERSDRGKIGLAEA